MTNHNDKLNKQMLEIILKKKKDEFFKWINLYLYDIVEMPTQFIITNNINMCCGISYLVIKYKNHLILNYLNNNIIKYKNLFMLLMQIASERKLSNPEINLEGEFINEKTIQQDFSNIYENMNYYEFIIGNFCEDNDKNIKQIEELIENLSLHKPIIMCCNVNVFVIFKLSDDELLIIDSHVPYHGKIKKNKFINYIILDVGFNGIISLGCYKN